MHVSQGNSNHFKNPYAHDPIFKRGYERILWAVRNTLSNEEPPLKVRDGMCVPFTNIPVVVYITRERKSPSLWAKLVRIVYPPSGYRTVIDIYNFATTVGTVVYADDPSYTSLAERIKRKVEISNALAP